MWEPLMAPLSAAGRRCIAPDLYGFGDSTDDGPATFETNLSALTAFHQELDLGTVALIVHDWGGFVGLAWACEHPESVEALVISDTGFFADGKWHGMAEAIRGPDGGAFAEAMNREAFEAMMRSQSSGFGDEEIAAYWEPFESGRGRRSMLEFYRSMDFEKLTPYQGRLASLGAPTLLLWGETDEFAPVAGAKRMQREVPGAELVVIEGAGHFVYDDEPQRCAAEVQRFLSR